MKRTPLRKTAKKHTLNWYKKKFWVVFSLYIRTRDNFTCVTCGKKGEGKGMHAGHYITKSVGGLSLYFHEQNVHAQCYHCNINLSGNWTAYEEFIIKTYGEEVDKELKDLRIHGFMKYSIEDYERLMEEYKQKTKELNG
jgi:5-methylcytosine-specific restriction endonuclease McrA